MAKTEIDFDDRVKVKVRHGVMPYTDRDGPEVAFRGQEITIPRAEAERLSRGDSPAVVDVSEELSRPGTIMALPVAATDAEIVSWLVAATDADIADLLARRPELAVRITEAKDYVDRQYEYQRTQLAKAQRAADTVDVAQVPSLAPGLAGSAMLGTDDGGQGATDPGTPGPSDPPDPNESPEERAAQADRVVAGNAESVADFIAEHPDWAADIVEAENRRVASGEGHPEFRSTIRRAAEAAAGHTG